MKDNIEHVLDEIVIIDDTDFQVREGNICPMCSLNDENIALRYKRCAALNCSRFSRKDKRDVVYVKIGNES